MSGGGWAGVMLWLLGLDALVGYALAAIDLVVFGCVR